jgi:tetrahydromethanopterin S-methyltransferase subunit B
MTWLPGLLDGFTTNAAIGFVVGVVVVILIAMLIASRERREYH